MEGTSHLPPQAMWTHSCGGLMAPFVVCTLQSAHYEDEVYRVRTVRFAVCVVLIGQMADSV